MENFSQKVVFLNSLIPEVTVDLDFGEHHQHLHIVTQRNEVIIFSNYFMGDVVILFQLTMAGWI